MSLAQAILGLRRSGDAGGLIALIPYAQWLGMEAELVNGELCLHLRARDDLVGNARLSALHGGVVSGFMEQAALMEMLWREAPERLPLSINFALDYLRSARLETTHAQCRVSRMGARLAQLQVRCWQNDPEHPVAIGRAHFLIERREDGDWPE